VYTFLAASLFKSNTEDLTEQINVEAENDRSLKVKKKLIPARGRGDPLGSETSRFPHFLDNRLTDGSGVVRHTRLPAALYPEEIPGTHFC
jgi:hypothetical protein